MSYNSSNFLGINSGISINFIDIDGYLKYTIKPSFVIDINIDNNTLKISLKNKRNITLIFANHNDATDALNLLNDKLRTLLQSAIYLDSKNKPDYSPYTYDTFLRPLSSSDRNIKILDINLIVQYIIDPFNTTNVNISNNILNINLKSGRIISLIFSTTTESKIALNRLQLQIDSLIKKVPLLIDKDVENFVNDKINGESIEYSLYHAMGNINTGSNKRIGDEYYKSGHNIRAKDIWTSDIPYSSSLLTSEQYSDDIIIRQLGLTNDPITLYPLYNSKFKTWFMDMGTPIFNTDGFIPTENMYKGLIAPTDVVLNGLPSFGYELQLFDPDGTAIPYNLSSYEVDYYSGFIYFKEGNTPKDVSNDLGFNFSKSLFVNSNDKIQFIKDFGPKAITWKYVGSYLTDIRLAINSGLVININGELSINNDNRSIKIDSDNKLFVYGLPTYDRGSPLIDIQTGSTGITISNTPNTYSNVKITVNGQVMLLGNENDDCFFKSNGVVKNIHEIEIGDELYWNSAVAGYELSDDDVILIIYEK